MLERYWCNLPIEEQLARIVFCGDGGSWIGHGVEALCQRMGLDKQKVYQVLDYTHTQQNLNEIISWLSPAQQEGLGKKWGSLLWKGSFTHQAKQQQAMSKFTRYCVTHQRHTGCPVVAGMSRVPSVGSLICALRRLARSGLRRGHSVFCYKEWKNRGKLSPQP
ncbi:MAG: hypothetical protein SVR94_12880 [Pseudomonadota bacterium]|nr:hypothetical protein [Pseudomonadota bacterium]